MIEGGVLHLTKLILFEPDLMFSSKVEGAAAKAGVPVKVFDNFERFIEGALEDTARLALVNLDAVERHFPMMENLAKSSPCRFVGYYSHVNNNLGAEARRIGFRAALSRGAFVNKLEGILREAASA
jgi:hypothetical protein